MPNSRSAKKRLRQNKKRRLHNKSFTSQARTQVKKFEAAVAAKDVDAAKREFKEVVRELDKVAGKGIIHKNMASRKKSRLHRALVRLTALAGNAPDKSGESQAETKSE